MGARCQRGIAVSLSLSGPGCQGTPDGTPGCWCRASVSPTWLLQVTKGCVQPQNHHGVVNIQGPVSRGKVPRALCKPLVGPSPLSPRAPPAPALHPQHLTATQYSPLLHLLLRNCKRRKKKGEKKKKKEFSVCPVLALLCTSHKPLPGLEGGGGAHGHHVPEPRLCIPVSCSLRGTAQGSPGGHPGPPQPQEQGAYMDVLLPARGAR